MCGGQGRGDFKGELRILAQEMGAVELDGAWGVLSLLGSSELEELERAGGRVEDGLYV